MLAAVVAIFPGLDGDLTEQHALYGHASARLVRRGVHRSNLRSALATVGIQPVTGASLTASSC